MIDVQKYIKITLHNIEYGSEDPWVAYFYKERDSHESFYMEYTLDAPCYDIYKTTPDEREAFDDWGLEEWVVIYNDSMGFIYGLTFSSYDAAWRFIHKELGLDAEDAEENQALMQREVSNNE